MDYYLSNYLSTYIPIFRVYEEGIWITIYPTICLSKVYEEGMNPSVYLSI